MHLRIRHQTTYAYQWPAREVAQLVRLFPRAHAGLELVRWRVSAAQIPALKPYKDGYGNRVALAATGHPIDTLSVTVEGDVETRDIDGRLTGLIEPLPPAFWTRTTPRTAPDAAIVALLEGLAGAPGTRAWAEALKLRVNDRIAFQPGATTVGATAAQALAAGAGVCQDHAHVFLSAARHAGIPARYVSGYLWTGRGEEPASHAWVEAHVDGEWVGLDPANGIFAGERHVRLAAGLDYDGAAPISGVRHGGGTETMDVRLTVRSAAEQ